MKTMKTKIIPFDLETAKKIQDGKIEGRIRTKEIDFTARIICFDKVKLVRGDGTTETQIVSLTYNDIAREDVLYVHNQKGEVQAPFDWEHAYDLVLEVPETEPEKPQFKPFEKVLVREHDDCKWNADFYSHLSDGIFMCVSCGWCQCIPYEGNEHLVGTTDKPKEDQL